MISVNVRESAWVVGVGLMAAACSTARMQVPPEISAKSEVLEVSERSSWSGSLADESFRLGPYAVTDVDRDWDTSSGFSLGGFSRKTGSGGYAFRFEGGGVRLAGKCASGQRDEGVDFGGVGLEFQFAKLGCECGTQGMSASVLIDGDGREYRGVVTTSGAKYPIQSVRDLEGGGSASSPTGYRLDGETGVAAADVMHPGRVWLDRALVSPERGEVACLLAGLLLYKPPKED